MSYTNGFDIDKVLVALKGRMGWQQPTESGFPALSAANLESRSKRFFNDGSFHAMNNLKFVRDVVFEAGLDDTAFNSKLESFQKAIILKALNNVFKELEYFEQVLLFNRLGLNDQVITNTGQFVGYQIDLAKKFDSAVQIDTVALYFNANATITLYLFKDGKKTPVWTKENVNVVANEQTVIALDDCVLRYIDSAANGGKYYFGYFQNDLGTAKAYQEQIESFNKTKLFCAQAMASVATGNDFNRNQIPYSVLSYGMNLEMSSFRDYTQLITKKAGLFDELVGLQMAYKIGEEVLYSTRRNMVERDGKGSIDKVGLQMDMMGAAPISESPQIKGLSSQINQEIAKIRKEFFNKPRVQAVNTSCYEDQPFEY